MEGAENKIIYLKISENSTVGRRRFLRNNEPKLQETARKRILGNLGIWWRNIISPMYPMERKEFGWLGYEVTAYVVYDDDQPVFAGKTGRSLQRRLGEVRMRRTREAISHEISQKGWDEVLLLKNDTELLFPTEMVYRFFEEKKRIFWKKSSVPEQLILIAPEEEEESVPEYLAEAVRLSYRLYPEYNYMTILTDQGHLFESVMEEAAQESGLYIRCMGMEKNVLFPDKRTVILDLNRELAPCYRHFPGCAMYVTPWNNAPKKRRLEAKCPQIACFSMLNDLDTVLHNTV